MHLEWQLPNPLQSNYDLQLVLKGIKRLKGQQQNQKAPVTPDMLLSMLKFLNLSNPIHANVWAAALCMFHTLLRRSNVLPLSYHKFNPLHQLMRGDFRFFNWGARVVIRWSKTIQFKERSLLFPLPRIHNHPLCPVQAIFHAFSFAPQAPPSSPAWVLSNGSNSILTVPLFLKVFKQVIHKAGWDPSLYSTHSFRRGGATWAYKCGIPADTIQILGDWKSDAYKAYIKPDIHVVHAAVTTFQSQFPTN